jgi:hypothetical protein
LSTKGDKSRFAKARYQGLALNKQPETLLRSDVEAGDVDASKQAGTVMTLDDDESNHPRRFDFGYDKPDEPRMREECSVDGTDRLLCTP